MRTRSGRKYDHEEKIIINKMDIDLDISRRNKPKKEKLKNNSVNTLIELFSSNLFIHKVENYLDDEIDLITKQFKNSCCINKKKKKKYPMLGKRRRRKKKTN